MDKQSCFICTACSSSIDLNRKQYHEQYECFRRIQEKRNQDKKQYNKISQRLSINSKQQQVKQLKKIMKGKGKSQIQNGGQNWSMRKSTLDLNGNKLFEEKPYMGRKQEKGMMSKKVNKGLHITKKPVAFGNAKRASAKSREQQSGEMVQCSICKQFVGLDQIEEHEFQCTIEVDCDFCGSSYSLMLLQQHYDMCEVKKLWQQEQQKKQYGSNVGYAYKQMGYGNKYYEEDYSYSQYQHQEQFQAPWNYQEPWAENKPKHKGLGKSKLGNLCYTSYRKPLQSPSIKQQITLSQKQQQKEQTPVEDEPCPICYINFQDKQTIIKLPCLHGYHPECVGKWFETDDRCPCCKVKVQ